jgi:hypothetical protein
VILMFDKVVRTKNGFVPGIKLLPALGDVGTSVLETKKRDTIDVKNSNEFLTIVVKLMQGLLDKHMVMKLPANLISVKLVQLEKQGRKISTKNGKEEVQSVKNSCMLTLVQSKELVLVDLKFGR